MRDAFLAELGRHALSGCDVDTLMQLACVQLRELLGADIAKVQRLDGDGLRVVAAIGWRDTGAVPSGVSQAGYTLAVDAPVVVADLASETRFAGTRLLVEHGIASGITTPIHARDRVYGVLGVHARAARMFSDDDGPFLSAVANVLGAAISDVEARARVETVAAGIAHDLNNVLQVIASTASLLEESIDDPIQRAEAQTIVSTVGRAKRFLRGMLALARSARPAATRIEINEVIADIAPMLRRIVGDDIAFVVAPTSLPTAIRGDRVELEQILLNLVINARDASGRGGAISIATWRATGEHGAEVVLSVADRGCGMTPEVLERIFEPMFTTKRAKAGTGLGLMIVAALVRRANAHIAVTSSPGAGSTFEVTFRADDALP